MSTTVVILLQHEQGVPSILEVFATMEACERRILSWIKRGDLSKLAGLEMVTRTVMTT